VSEKRTLLAVFAHPDDESFGPGGTLARYAVEGMDVHLVCATNGKVGVMGKESMAGYCDPADRRIAELRCAASQLGLSGPPPHMTWTVVRLVHGAYHRQPFCTEN
jgi:LmbE family N-acetylglucosaminyl deacetylase